MKKRRGAKAGALTVADVPALAEFARGYLHQDVFAEHGSAPAAIRAYLNDGGDGDALIGDIGRVVDAAAHWSPASLGQFFVSTLGAAWSPASADDLRAMWAAGRMG